MNFIRTYHVLSFHHFSTPNSSQTPYDNLYTGNRVKLGEMAKEYSEADVHRLPDVGNGPHFAYILRDREWKGGE